MEKPFTTRWKRQAFPTGSKQLYAQPRLQGQFTHSPTTPTTANIHPFLSNPKEKKEHKKRTGARPSDEPRSHAPFLCLKSVDYRTFTASLECETLRIGKHTGCRLKSRYRRLFDRF